MFNQNIDLFQDSYYQRAYTELYLSSDESIFEFVYREFKNKVLFRSIKRKIEQVADSKIDMPLYDLESHYGYGGPLSTLNDQDFIMRAFIAYRKKCVRERIVCEFIRFHPFNFINNKSEYFDFHAQDRSCVIVNLACSTEDRWALYSKTTRNIIRRVKKILTVEINSISNENFMSIYYDTMNKNEADKFYYFKASYFEALTRNIRVELFSIKNKSNIISCGYFMYGRDIAHYHLSANNRDFIKEDGNYLLLEAAFERAKELGCHTMMLGGGRTSMHEDGLFIFKKKFSPKTTPYYVAGLNFMPDKKRELNAIWDTKYVGNKINYFQKYRLK